MRKKGRGDPGVRSARRAEIKPMSAARIIGTLSGPSLTVHDANRRNPPPSRESKSRQAEMDVKMTDSEFLDVVDEVLSTIESRVEAADEDITTERSGNVLNLEFDDGSKIVVNSQVAMHELWVAARAGGFHLKLKDGKWIDSRSGDELFAMLSRLASEHSGATLDLTQSI
jgi:CyaY protein